LRFSQLAQLPAFSLMLNAFMPNAWLDVGSHIDFGSSGLGCQFSSRRLFVLKSITRHCGWIFPFRRLLWSANGLQIWSSIEMDYPVVEKDLAFRSLMALVSDSIHRYIHQLHHQLIQTI